jgi:invasion protein IalB
MQNFFGARHAPVSSNKAVARKGGRLCFFYASLPLPARLGSRAQQTRRAAMLACAAAVVCASAPQVARAKDGSAPGLGPRVAASGALGSPATATSAANSTERLFGSWSLICSTQKPPRCGLTQAVATDPAGKQVVLGAAVHPVPELGKLRLEFRVSGAADPKAGIGMKFQDGPEFRLPMSGCTKQFCAASGVLEGPIRDALENGKAVQLAFMMPGPKQALVPLALAGLKEGLSELEKASQPVRAAPAGSKK